jgi:polysaccharide deacetylase 2 family uncharacterized protein YibQ
MADDDDDDLLFDDGEDDDEEIDFEDDDAELDAAAEADDVGGDPDLDDIDIDDIDLDAMDFGEDEFEEKPARSKKKVVVLALAGIFLFAVLSAGSALILLGGDDETADQPGLEIPEGAVASLAIPPKGKMRSSASQLREKMARGETPAEKTQTSTPRQGLQPPAPASPQTSTSSSSTPAGDQPPPVSAPATNNGETSTGGAAPPGPAPGAGSTQVAGARNIGGAGMIVPAITAAAYTGIRPAAKSRPLSAPNPRLIETVDGRILPKIGDNGRESRKEYAHRFGGDPNLPRIGIIIRELGLSRNATLAAINYTSALVTLSFTPYARGVEEWMGLARSSGHEAILELPLETIDFPSTDPGPLALLTDVSQDENVARLNKLMSTTKAYVGMIQFMGSRFATSEAAFRPVLQTLKNRGLIFVDDNQVSNSLAPSIAQQIQLAFAKVDVTIDANPSEKGVLAALHQLEEIARKKKFALGTATAYPSVVKQISRWTPTLTSKKIELAPLSAIAQVAEPPKPAEAEGGN